MKKIIKSIIFIIIFCVIFKYVSSILWLNPTPISKFYDEPKNSLDVVYIGASNAYVHFNTTLAYKKYGFTTGLISTDSQPPMFIKYFLKEAQKYQKPKLYVIDLVNFMHDDGLIEEVTVRKSLDSMKFSSNRIEALEEALPYLDIEKREYINYYFSFLKYHNRWKELSKINFTKVDEGFYKGYLFSKLTSGIEPQEDYVWNSQKMEISQMNKEVLDELIEYLKSTNLEVLFVIPKRIYRETEVQKLNDVIEILEENDFKVINFNTLDDFDVDLENDLYNYGHLNVYGATKYTLYFSKYLSENYDLKDHRNDKKYSSWDKEYERFKKSFKTLLDRDFDEVLNEYDIY